MKKVHENKSLNARRLGVEEKWWTDLYHRLLRQSGPRFFAAFLLVFLGINTLFAALYAAFPHSIANAGNHDFFSCFAFSVQTLSTIGYGYFYPLTATAHALVTVESATGMFFNAVLTGLVFAKFARPSARIVFSNHALYTAQNGQPILTLRLGNMRTNRVFEGKAKLHLLRDEVSSEGERLRRIFDLALVRHETPVFALSWTLIHPITEQSPLWGVNPEEFHEKGWDLIVTFVGIDQDMAQTITASKTYSGAHVVRARKFVDMIHLDEGVRVIDFSKLHQIEN